MSNRPEWITERSCERYYAPAQVARNLVVSTAWINKMQQNIPICVDEVAAKERGIGKRTTLSTHEYKMIRKVRTLRAIGYSIKEINEIFDNEVPYRTEIKKRLRLFLGALVYPDKICK